MALVFANFKMPGVGLVPDYDERILRMRGEGGIDRDVFIRKVYLPTLQQLGIQRHEMLAAQREAIQARRAQEAAQQESDSAAE